MRDIGRDMRDIGRDMRDIGRDIRDIGRDIRDIVIIIEQERPPRIPGAAAPHGMWGWGCRNGLGPGDHSNAAP